MSVFARYESGTDFCAFPVWTMAYHAFFSENSRAFLGRSAPRRKAFAVRADGDVLSLDVLLRGGAADALVGRHGGLCGRGGRNERDGGGEQLRKSHFSRSRPGSLSRAGWRSRRL